MVLEFFGGIASARWTERAEGDICVSGSSGKPSSLSGGDPNPTGLLQVARLEPSGLLRAVAGGRQISWARQVHGNGVLVVGSPGEHVGEEADALVTTNPEVALMVRTADCAPMALAAAEGVVGVAHGGWRGLLAGVVESACTAMRQLGATQIAVALGPCIHSCCYPFSSGDLDPVAAVLGDSVRSRDRHGRPALDLPGAVAAAVARAGAELTFSGSRCTACAEVDGVPSFWSHRARQEAGRQAVVAWLN